MRAFYNAGAQDFEQIQPEFAAVKESLARNGAALRQYSWTAHTEISRKGEVKRTTTESCRYGPDGTVQTTSIRLVAAAAETRGVLRRAADTSSNSIQKYVRRAAALIRNYVSPFPDRLQALFESGNAYFGKAGPDELGLRPTLRAAFQPLSDATGCVAATILSTAAEDIQLKTQNEDDARNVRTVRPGSRHTRERSI